VGFDEEVKKRFREDLDEVVRVILHSEKLVISGDFNGHTELATSSFDGVYGGFGFGVRNKGGVSLLNFAKAFELVITNSCFRTREDHRVPSIVQWPNSDRLLTPLKG